MIEDLSLRTVEARLARNLLEQSDAGTVRRKRWAKPLGLGAGLMTLIAGVPLAVYSTLQEGLFSMFSPAPLLALLLLLVLLVPAGGRMVTCWLESKPKTQTAAA